MTVDDEEALRRRLRFSRFLQVAATVLFFAAFGVRVVRSGWDGLALLFLLAGFVGGAAVVLTTRALRGFRH